MLMPKRVKYRKPHGVVKLKGVAKRGTKVDFGDYGMKAMEPSRITSRQIEAARVALMRMLKKKGKVWIRIFPDRAITKHPAETRMGKGKGAPDHWVAAVKPGRVMFEMEGVDEATARRAMTLAAAKLPILTRFVTRHSS